MTPTQPVSDESSKAVAFDDLPAPRGAAVELPPPYPAPRGPAFDFPPPSAAERTLEHSSAKPVRAAKSDPAVKSGSAVKTAPIVKSGAALKSAGVPTTPTPARVPETKATKPTMNALPAHTAEGTSALREQAARDKRWIPALVLVPVLSVTAVLLVLNGASVAPATQPIAVAQAPVAAAGPARDGVNAWLAQNATADQIVVTDASTPLTAWRDADLVVVDEAMRTNLVAGSPLAQSVANSVLVATFGTGTDAIEVRRVTPEGSVLAAATAAQDASDRVDFGSQTARNPGVQMSTVNRELLTTGRVDSRISFVLGSLAAEGEVLVSDFPVIDGEQAGVIRQVSLTIVGGTALAQNGTLTAAGTDVVAALSGPFTPADVAVDGSSLVLRYPLTPDPFNG